MKELNDEMGCLNDELRCDFSVEKLDERLETDPLILPTMIDIQGLGNDSTVMEEEDITLP